MTWHKVRDLLGILDLAALADAVRGLFQHGHFESMWTDLVIATASLDVGLFRSSEAKLEVIQTYSSRDFVVLVMIERQTAEVGGLANQDWSLRVTEVYRKVGSGWQLAIAMPIRWFGG